MSSAQESPNTAEAAAAAAAPVTAPKLQTLNYVNVVAYLFNFLVVYGSMQAGLPDNGTLSDKYQTLVTPAPYAFSIWGIIFTSELIWTVVQLLPAYRSHKLVIHGVGYRFALASLAQCAWTIIFALEHMALSLVAMVGILIPLLKILAATSSIKTPASEYWLLKFPFEIHASWIMAATLVNVNVVLVAYKASSMIQTVVGALSLLILVSVGVYALVNKSYGKVWVTPSVLLWASFAISGELSSPRQQIVDAFSMAVIEHIRIASATIGYLLALTIVIQLIRIRFFPDHTETEGEEYSNLNASE